MKGLKDINANNIEEYNIYHDYQIELQEIKKIDMIKFRLISLFAFTESYAQDYSMQFSNIKCNAKIFTDFIENFAMKKDTKYCDDLQKNDPINVYYKNKSIFNSISINITGLEDTKAMVQKINEIEQKTIKNNNILTEKCKRLDLLYGMRSKLVHENRTPFDLDARQNQTSDIFYWRPIGINGGWKLCFTYKYLENLFIFAIKNYFDYCESKSTYPFKNRYDIEIWGDHK